MRRGMRMGPGTTTSMVRSLLIINAIVFFLQLFTAGSGFSMMKYFALIPAYVLRYGFIWQLVTYQFLHGGFFHILINMFVLWMFGVELERRWGAAGFLRFYLVCGIAGGAAMVIFNYGTVPVVGASGAVLGLLGAYAIYWPERMVYVWGIFPIQVKHFVFIIGGFSLLAGVSESEAGIAHMAHLGGVLMGYIYCKFGDPRKPLLGSVFSGVGDFIKKAKIQDKKSEWEEHRRNKEEIIREADAILDEMEEKEWEDLSEEKKKRIKEIAKILDGFPSRPSGRR
ncbi:MAG: rhomboid family intramembrane serine protease [bacterium]